MREWALLAVRNLTEGCAENQATIAQIEQLSKPKVRRDENTAGGVEV